MGKIRQTRLQNDYQSVRTLAASCCFKDSYKLKILQAQGNPPENYRLEITNCRGIKAVINNKPQYSDRHVIKISNFPQDYPDPGQLPIVRAETTLFHPNVYSDGRFCFAGAEINKVNQPLDALIRRIVSMIQYENLRFGVPANSQAKNWADRYLSLFPLSPDSSSTASTAPQLRWR